MAGDVVSDEQEYTRLHITPLTPALLPTFLPPSVFPIARNISYHTLETFPERPYGFVELPKMDATKLQKKLNGSILKGTKIRIETARPQNLHVPDGEPEPERPKRERGTKRKRDETIPGIEIGERSVKRGWTVPTSQSNKKSDKKEKKAKSKYTDKTECLFKTVVPPNKVDLKGKKKKNTREEVVHEFEKSTKHASFLRISKVDGKSKIASEFVEGKGWVDEDGNVIEEVKTKRKSTTGKEDTPSDGQTSEDDSDSSHNVELAEPHTKQPVEEDDANTSEDESSRTSSSSEEPSPENEKSNAGAQDHIVSSSDSSSEQESESSEEYSDSESESADETSRRNVEIPSESSRSTGKSNSRPVSSSGLTITIPQPDIFATSTSNSKTVHPLEALYKRPASTLSSKSQTGSSKPDVPLFSFFGNDKDAEKEESESYNLVPLTPFTQRDFEFRGQRSAAPTPDTAHPNKRFMWPVDNESDEEGDEDDGSVTPSGKGKGKATTSKDGEEGAAPESDFQKWFYEHRGDTNRAWKKRRKTAAKETRQRENRKRSDRAT